VRSKVRLVSWNVKQLDVREHLAKSDADIALLQEAPPPLSASGEAASDSACHFLPSGDATWETLGWDHRPWRTAIVRLSDEVELRAIPTGSVSADAATLRVSRPGTITAATVAVEGRDIFTVASVYALWEQPLSMSSPIWADASAHRLLSDLAPLVGRRLPLVVSGDWNILRGYGEHGDAYWAARYQTVFDRAEAMGLTFVGPAYPNGRRAEHWPSELPKDSTCVPTFHHSQQSPETATRQLDFVFASDSLASRIRTQALNEPDDWGPSDHCRIQIDVDL
jgi:hypothetical protein